MEGNNTFGVGQTQAQYVRKKRALTALALLSTLLIVSVLVSVFFYNQEPPTNNPTHLVSFTCRLSSSNQTYTIDVEINLSNGMDQDEAMRVASEVYDRERVHTLLPPTMANVTAYTRENGVWVIEFNAVYTGVNHFGKCTIYQILNEQFYATINPIDQTVVYKSILSH